MIMTNGDKWVMKDGVGMMFWCFLRLAFGVAISAWTKRSLVLMVRVVCLSVRASRLAVWLRFSCIHLARRERKPEKDIISCQVSLFVIVKHVTEYDICLISMLEYQHLVKAM